MQSLKCRCRLPNSDQLLGSLECIFWLLESGATAMEPRHIVSFWREGSLLGVVDCLTDPKL